MTHYLRKNGVTVVDTETSANDLSCVVCINSFSELLLAEPERAAEVAEDFNGLQEMRGEWFETVKQSETPSEFAERKMRRVADKYDLQYVTD